MKRLFVAALALATALIAAPALAGNITIRYVGLRQVAYHVACVAQNNHVGPMHIVHQSPGSHRIIGHAGCLQFNIQIETQRGRIEHYQLQAGRRYRLFFNNGARSWEFSRE